MGAVSFKGKRHTSESKRLISEAGKMKTDEFNRRKNEYDSIEKKFGWITELSKSWNISNTQTKRFIEINFNK